jgi:hypothetical protein
MMTRIRNDRTRGQRRRAGTTLVLAAATGGLLAAAMAGSPTARADDPYTDILNDSQAAITLGEADYTTAGTDFSTAGGTNEGLIAAFTGFDNIFVSPTDYTLLGLTAAATDTNFSGYGTDYNIPLSDLGATTAAGQTADAATYLADAQTYFTEIPTDLSSGEYFNAAFAYVTGSYFDLLSSQADTLAGLFSAGI